MNVEKISKEMDAFEKQFEDIDVRAKYMEDAMGNTTASATPEDQVDALISQVADEHQLDVSFALDDAGQVGSCSAAAHLGVSTCAPVTCAARGGPWRAAGMRGPRRCGVAVPPLDARRRWGPHSGYGLSAMASTMSDRPAALRRPEDPYSNLISAGTWPTRMSLRSPSSSCFASHALYRRPVYPASPAGGRRTSAWRRRRAPSPFISSQRIVLSLEPFGVIVKGPRASFNLWLTVLDLGGTNLRRCIWSGSPGALMIPYVVRAVDPRADPIERVERHARLVLSAAARQSFETTQRAHCP